MNHPESCIQCGTCIDVCPVEKVGGHAIVTFLADPNAADYSVWLCTSCWRCQEARPADVDIYELMMQERRREEAPAGYRAAFDSVLDCSLALEIPQEELDQMRADWGLERVRIARPDLVRSLLRGGE